MKSSLPTCKTSKSLVLAAVLTGSVLSQGTMAQQQSETRHISLAQAIDLAVKQNRSVQLASQSIDQMTTKKAEAKSDYLPQLKVDGKVLHVTQLAGIEIPAGSFGSFPSAGVVPSQALFIGQGTDTAYAAGVTLEQPITQLWRIHQANVVASQNVRIARTRFDQTRDEIALKVRQVYYGVLINAKKLQASQDALNAAKVKLTESERDVEHGNALQLANYQAQASLLQATQNSLIYTLQGEDLRRQLDDLLGLPLSTRLELDESVAANALDVPLRDDAVRSAIAQNHDLIAARQTLAMAKAGLSAARDAYIPDLTGLSKYSYQSGVPLLVHNFGTFGFTLNYDLFDGGRRKSRLRSAEVTVSSAEVMLAKLQSEVSVQIESAYDRVEQIRQLEDVATQTVKVREEALRISDRQLEQSTVLNSVRSQARADLGAANAALLETDLQLSLAVADLRRMIGILSQ